MSKNYMTKKIMLNFVFINIVINGVFYFVNFKGHVGTLTIEMIEKDIIFGICMLGILCSATGFINTKKDLLTGHVPTQRFKGARLLNQLPKSNFMRTVILTVVVIVATAITFILVPKVLGVTTINHTVGFIIKTLSAALSASLIGYIVIVLCTEDYRHLKLNN